MTSQIVLISGKQGSGKTTLQKNLMQAWCSPLTPNRGAIEVNFADIIYEMHDAVLEKLHMYWKPRGLVKDGPLLQLLGTEWGRKTIDENIWVKCLQARIANFREDNQDLARDFLIVVGDCRFENELDGFPEALKIRLEADEEIRKKRCSMWRKNIHHPSETGLDRYAAEWAFDMRLRSDVDDPQTLVRKVMAELEQRKANK